MSRAKRIMVQGTMSGAGKSLLCAALSYTVSRVLTAPLEGLSRASRAIASGNYASRVRVRSSDEVGMVSQDFNVMADRLERQILELRQSVERQERFVGSFAHEMKTPMTSLIGYAELIRSGTLTQEEQSEAAGYLYSEGKRLESLSRKLLDLLEKRPVGLVLPVGLKRTGGGPPCRKEKAQDTKDQGGLPKLKLFHHLFLPKKPVSPCPTGFLWYRSITLPFSFSASGSRGLRQFRPGRPERGRSIRRSR